jgi:protease-4
MWRAIQLLKKKKPVVVSMGGMAASGGYYMACGADYIVAEPTTLTGSIGIFGMVPDATGLLTQKLGLHFDVVKTNEASDFGAMGRAFNDGESRAMQAYVDRGYALFLRRVAAGRRMTTDRVDSIAQGRVWTGQQALKLGLVDSLGTLRDAIAVAACRAHIQQYALTEQPVQGDWWDDLLNRYRSDYMENRVRTVLGEYYQPLRFAASLQGRDCLQARMPFEPHLR